MYHFAPAGNTTGQPLSKISDFELHWQVEQTSLDCWLKSLRRRSFPTWLSAAYINLVTLLYTVSDICSTSLHYAMLFSFHACTAALAFCSVENVYLWIVSADSPLPLLIHCQLPQCVYVFQLTESSVCGQTTLSYWNREFIMGTGGQPPPNEYSFPMM